MISDSHGFWQGNQVFEGADLACVAVKCRSLHGTVQFSDENATQHTLICYVVIITQDSVECYLDKSPNTLRIV